MSENTETLTFFVKVGSNNIKFGVPVTMRIVHFTPVTKHSNVGIDVEYIVENEYLKIKVPPSSKEGKALAHFKDEFEIKVREIMLIEDINLTYCKLELKKYMKSLILGNVDFETYLLEEKRKLANDVAIRICKERNLPIIYINFDGCLCEKEGKLAHYHLKHQGVVCISNRQLRLLNYDEIKEVIAYDVTHALILEHSDNFSKEEVIRKIWGWEPSSGVVVTFSKEPPLPESVIERIENLSKTMQVTAEHQKEEDERKIFYFTTKKNISLNTYLDTRDELS